MAWGLWATELLIFLGVSFVAVRRVGLDAVRLAGLDSATPGSVARGFAFGAVNYVAWALPLMAIAQAIFPRRLVEAFDSSAIFARQSPVEVALLVAGVGLAAPVCEEFFFRGVLQSALGERLAPSAAVVVTALVFSLFHLDPVGFVARFELGVVFGLLAWRSGSLWPAIAAHSANNLLSTALFFAGRNGGLDAEAELPWWGVALAFLLGNAALALLARSSTGKLEAPRPAAVVQRASPGWWRLLGPWAALGAALVLGLLAADVRGVRLSVIDVTTPVDRARRDDVRLLELRQKARRGDANVDEYRDYRRRLAKP